MIVFLRHLDFLEHIKYYLLLHFTFFILCDINIWVLSLSPDTDDFIDCNSDINSDTVSVNCDIFLAAKSGTSQLPFLENE